MGKSDLLVSPNMLRQIEYALSFVMTKKSHLFKDRHLDQIILAVVYVGKRLVCASSPHSVILFV